VLTVVGAKTLNGREKRERLVATVSAILFTSQYCRPGRQVYRQGPVTAIQVNPIARDVPPDSTFRLEK
jgi:hypothetical protein